MDIRRNLQLAIHWFAEALDFNDEIKFKSSGGNPDRLASAGQPRRRHPWAEPQSAGKPL